MKSFYGLIYIFSWSFNIFLTLKISLRIKLVVVIRRWKSIKNVKIDQKCQNLERTLVVDVIKKKTDNHDLSCG